MPGADEDERGRSDRKLGDLNVTFVEEPEAIPQRDADADRSDRERDRQCRGEETTTHKRSEVHDERDLQERRHAQAHHEGERIERFMALEQSQSHDGEDQIVREELEHRGLRLEEH